MPEIQVSALNVYPVKSAAGIPLESARVLTRGLEHDRRWMVVDEDGMFISQREIPKLAVICVALEGEHLVLSAPGAKRLEVPLNLRGARRNVQVWNDPCEGVDAGEGAARWLSSVIGSPCSLVHMPEDARRTVTPKFAQHGEEVGFADVCPFMLISEASLEELNRRMDAPLPMNRFRPNIVVRGCEPFDEDSWDRFRIGDVSFHAVNARARCTIPTVDQQTGRVAGKEPLRTLATFRRAGGSVVFGQDVVHHGTGTLKIGDAVEIVSRKAGSENSG